jgi:hypothetical protein
MRKILPTTVLASMVLLACSEERDDASEIPAELQRTFHQVAKLQSTGFIDGTCTVQKAFQYGGVPPFEIEKGNKILGLVVEISGYLESFDFDDIDLIDADTDENLGSYPQIGLMRNDGMADFLAKEWPKAPGPVTVLLLYERDKLPRRIKLAYWGSEIVSQPIEVAANGSIDWSR